MPACMYTSYLGDVVVQLFFLPPAFVCGDQTDTTGRQTDRHSLAIINRISDLGYLLRNVMGVAG